MAKKNGEKFSLIMLVSVALLAYFVGAMAAPKTGAGKGFDNYGYNEGGTVFHNCWTNYMKWKAGQPAITCPEDDMEVLIKWHIGQDDKLDWVLNLFYSPIAGSHVLKRYVPMNQQACIEAGGRWLNLKKITPTGEVIPMCEIMVVSSGQGALLVATPAGFGAYTGE